MKTRLSSEMVSHIHFEVAAGHCDPLATHSSVVESLNDLFSYGASMSRAGFALSCVSVLLLQLCEVNRASAQDRQMIESVKSSCFLAEISGEERRYATAFCIHPSGIVVTNHHVVDQMQIGDTINLIANAGLENQKAYQARLLRTDEPSDLAVLKITESGEFKSIEIAKDPEFYETQQIVAFGFPFGKSLALEEEAFPTISVNTGKITSVRKDKTETQLLQLDATLNPGNSGGPVIDSKGQVVGVVSFGVAGAGVNFAIPSEKLRRILTKPDMDLQVPEITDENFYTPKTVEVTLTPLVEEIVEPSVEFWIKRGDEASQKFLLNATAPNKFQANVVVKPEPAKKLLHGRLLFKQGKIEGKIRDATIKTDGKEIQLAQVASLTPNPSSQKIEVSMRDGSSRKIGVQDLPSMKVDLGGFEVNVDLANVGEIAFDADDSESKIAYIVIVKSGGKEIYRSINGEIAKATNPDGKANSSEEMEKTLEASPSEDRGGLGGASVDNSSAIVFKGPAKSIPVPGTLSDAVFARGGKYLLAVLGVEKKLVVIQTGKGTIEKILPLSSDDVLVAGTMNHIVIFDRKKNVIERYGLDNFGRQVAVKPPFSGVVKNMVAGSASDGPIVMQRSSGTDSLSNASLAVVDLMKLKELPVTTKQTGHYSAYRDEVHIRAAPNGRVFGMWATSHSPSGMQSMVLTDSRMITKYEHDSVGHVVPNADGSHILTSAGVFNAGLRRIGGRGNEGWTQNAILPTSHPRFILAVQSSVVNQSSPLVATIREIGSETPLFELPDLQIGELDRLNPEWMQNDFTFDKRVFLDLEGHALISIPFTNDRVVIQEFDVQRALRESDVDYFFVSSTPNRTFTPGKPYAYQVNVESNRKNFKFEIATGPDKMKISPKGKVTWDVPREFREESVDVIISISDGGSLQTFETYTIYNTRMVGKLK
jgi:S1-C subfamily serine protease